MIYRVRLEIWEGAQLAEVHKGFGATKAQAAFALMLRMHNEATGENLMLVDGEKQEAERKALVASLAAFKANSTRRKRKGAK